MTKSGQFFHIFSYKFDQNSNKSGQLAKFKNKSDHKITYFSYKIGAPFSSKAGTFTTPLA